MIIGNCFITGDDDYFNYQIYIILILIVIYTYIMNGLDANTICIAFVMIVIFILSIIFRWYFKEKKDIKQQKDTHSNILRDRVLKKWVKMGIAYDDQDIMSITYPEIETIEKKKEYLWTIQHFEKKYPSILKSWNNLKSYKYKRNKQSTNLKEDMYNIIRSEIRKTFPDIPEFNERYKVSSGNCYYINCIFTQIYNNIYNSFKSNEKMSFDFWQKSLSRGIGFILYDGQYELLRLDHKQDNFITQGHYNKCISLVKRIADINEIQIKVEKIFELTKRCKDERDNFKEQVEDIISKINHGSTLKGRCDYCKRFLSWPD